MHANEIYKFSRYYFNIDLTHLKPAIKQKDIKRRECQYSLSFVFSKFAVRRLGNSKTLDFLNFVITTAAKFKQKYNLPFKQMNDQTTKVHNKQFYKFKCVVGCLVYSLFNFTNKSEKWRTSLDMATE